MNLQRKASIFFNCLIIVVSIIIGLLGYHSANEGFEIALEDKADSDIRQSLAILDLKYPGEWQVINGNLYKGEQKIDGAFEIVDELGKLTGNNVTIFSGSKRGSTTFQQNGKRSVGTEASQEVIATVLRGNDEFKGEAEVLGDKYFCVYAPIKSSNGSNIGMLFMGIPKSEVDALQTSF